MSSLQGIIVFTLTEHHPVSILANLSVFARDQISKHLYLKTQLYDSFIQIDHVRHGSKEYGLSVRLT
jgi:hypothetical protein